MSDVSWERIAASRRGTLVRVRRAHLPQLCPLRYATVAKYHAVVALDAERRRAATAAERTKPGTKRKRPTRGARASSSAAPRVAPSLEQVAVRMGGAASRMASDGFYGRILEWDPNALRGGGRRGGGGLGTPLRKVPLRFDSAAEYIAVFEPLLMAEVEEEMREGVARASRGGGRVGTVVEQHERRTLPGMIIVSCAGAATREFRVGDLAVLAPPTSAHGAPPLAFAQCIAASTFKVTRARWAPLHSALAQARDAVGGGGGAHRSQLTLRLSNIGCFVTARRQHQVLHMVDSLSAARALMGAVPPPPDHPPPPLAWAVRPLGAQLAEYCTSSFNTSQRLAMNAAMTQSGGAFTLIKGPPGTGKTRTLVGLLNLLHFKRYADFHADLKQRAAPVAPVAPPLSARGGDGGRGDSGGGGVLSNALRAIAVAESRPPADSNAARPPMRKVSAFIYRYISREYCSRFDLPLLIYSYSYSSSFLFFHWKRILVVAPSNTATDEVARRVMRGFVAGNGSSYSPSLVRLGNKTAISIDVQAISLEGQLEETLAVNRDPANLPPGVISLARALQQRKNETRIQNIAVEELQKAVHKAWAAHTDIATAIRAQGAPMCAAPRWTQAEHSTAHSDLASADVTFKSYAHAFVVQTELLLRMKVSERMLCTRVPFRRILLTICLAPSNIFMVT